MGRFTNVTKEIICIFTYLCIYVIWNVAFERWHINILLQHACFPLETPFIVEFCNEEDLIHSSYSILIITQLSESPSLYLYLYYIYVYVYCGKLIFICFFFCFFLSKDPIFELPHKSFSAQS